MRGSIPVPGVLLAGLSVGLWCGPVAAPAWAQSAMPVVLPLRERAEVIDHWLERRLETVAPEIMRREEVDLWIVAAREYNEDPVIETMLPSTYMAARRRTVLILHDRGPGQTLERLAVARYDIGPFPRAWDPDEEPDQWGRVAEIIAERDPERISVNRSSTFRPRGRAHGYGVRRLHGRAPGEIPRTSDAGRTAGHPGGSRRGRPRRWRSIPRSCGSRTGSSPKASARR